MCRVMIPRQDLSEQLQAAVVQVCRGNINYTDHLDICGYITVIADGQTLSSFEFHKNIQSDRESGWWLQEFDIDLTVKPSSPQFR